MPDGSDLYARPRHVGGKEDCFFYHVMDVPDDGSVGGLFDLRGAEDEYLGGIALDGRRVLEIGPASGFLTFHMESRGASVVAVELPPGADWDIVPHATLDIDVIREERRRVMEQLRNGFWWAHERTGSRAKVHYGDVYALPAELGRFDVATMAAVLRHTRDPLRIVEGCARHAETVVITEMSWPELDGSPTMRLFPSRESETWDTWWHFGPDVLAQFLGVLGFDPPTVTYHEQRFLADGVGHQIPFFTLVASRPPATTPQSA